jgi:hypothetical protein
MIELLTKTLALNVAVPLNDDTFIVALLIVALEIVDDFDIILHIPGFSLH